MARPEDMYEEDEDQEELPPPAAGWMDALQEQFGSVPWWIVSTVVHVIILLLTTLIVVSTPRAETTDTIIPMDLVKMEEKEEPEVKKRDVFEKEREIDMPEEVEHPVFIHEEVEVRDHMETANNMDDNTARGQEDAISDIPLGGTGVVGNIGVGGGGAGCFGFRTGGGRRRAALRGGGSHASESAVDAALRWLVRHQEPDGHWALQKWDGKRDEDGNVGVTGLGLLAFLGAGHTEKTGQHKDTVRKAVAYLISKQNAQGMIGTNNSWQEGGGYNHAIAGLALAEAFGMARVPETGVAAQKAIDWSINHHQRHYSGWRYNPNDSDVDTSVSGWFIMQLKSGTVAGLRVDAKGFQGAIAWLDKVTDMPGQGGQTYGGRARYQPGREVSPSMTAVAMLGRQFMGWKRDDPLLVGGANYLLENLPAWGQGPQNNWMFYYWYYGTLVMFQMGGDWWKAWNNAMRDMLIKNQHNTPNDLRLDGSWDPILDGEEGGRAYSTAMCALCLEVYYRYLPIYK